VACYVKFIILIDSLGKEVALLVILTVYFVFKGVRECSAFAKSRLTGGAKPNVPFVWLAKIELKKSAVAKNKKYRRVGNECRLT
jgi:hypothetical protein